MLWWYWIVIGLVLLAGEVTLTGGFDLLFFGIAALLVGVLAGVGLLADFTLQCVVFSVLSIASLVAFRRPLLTRFKLRGATHQDMDTLVGEGVHMLTDAGPDGTGKGELRGTTWRVRNAGARALARGERAIVERVEGLMLWVKAE
ncbi:MAG TPA: NfeD family protein [Nitrospirales bacterium]|nr:NfeD family protein [Nitrospirales bacterium]